MCIYKESEFSVQPSTCRSGVFFILKENPFVLGGAAKGITGKRDIDNIILHLLDMSNFVGNKFLFIL